MRLNFVFQVLQRSRTLTDGSRQDRKSTRLNSSHVANSYAVFCLKKKKYRECCFHMPIKRTLREKSVTQCDAEDVHQELALKRGLFHSAQLASRLKFGLFQQDRVRAVLSCPTRRAAD